MRFLNYLLSLLKGTSSLVFKGGIDGFINASSIAVSHKAF